MQAQPMPKGIALCSVVPAVAFALAARMCHVLLAEDRNPIGGFTLVGLLHDDRALNGPHDVELQGNIAYVPGKGGRWH